MLSIMKGLDTPLEFSESYPKKENTEEKGFLMWPPLPNPIHCHIYTKPISNGQLMVLGIWHSPLY